MSEDAGADAVIGEGECSICGLQVLRSGESYCDGQLVACHDGHIAMVSIGEADAGVFEADPASQVIEHLGSKDGAIGAWMASNGWTRDMATIAEAVRNLERRASDAEGAIERAINECSRRQASEHCSDEERATLRVLIGILEGDDQ